ncbi:autotransporter domain-containing protein [Devosia sp. LjRoot3]|uniref:autotransporter domain-containing protein n=1 Tax=Devosia sp. LjRoot3 TaxID=3342319 RepID=UPI003ECEB50A
MRNNHHRLPGSARASKLPLAVLALMGCSALTPSSALAGGDVAWFLDWLSPARLMAISADGKVVGGYVSNGAYPVATVWSAADGRVDLGSNGGLTSAVHALSPDGSSAVGYWVTSTGKQYAMRWTKTGGMEDLGSLGVDGFAFANAMSADGSVVVGTSDHDNTNLIDERRAFRWVEGGTGGDAANPQMYSLGTLGGQYSTGTGVSADGTIIVGDSDNGMGSILAYRWTEGTGMIGLGHLGGGHSFANAISADGSTIVGRSLDAENTVDAYRWREDIGMQSLGTLAGDVSSHATAVSADGSVIVGRSFSPGTNTAFRWTEQTQMQSVSDWLAAGNVSAPVWDRSEATGVSADGTVVVGNSAGADGVWHPYIARVTPTTAGVIDPTKFAASLYDATQTAYAAQQLSFLPLNGAHHQPLMTQQSLAEDSCVWATGDIGYSGHGRDGGAGLAEVGACHDFADNVRAGLGVGKSGAWQNLALGGSMRADGQYIVGEIDWAPEGTPLLLSATALYGGWATTTRRGYANGGGTDYSEGSTHARAAMLRARIDWLDAASLGATTFSPWAALTLSQTNVDGYTEQGGAFPARFDALAHTAAELRVGLTAKRPITDATTLTGTIEAVHRFDATGPATSGETLGLFAFNLPGQAQNQTWLRVGADLEHKFSASAAGSLSLHASTNGQDAALSGAAGLRFSF